MNNTAAVPETKVTEAVNPDMREFDSRDAAVIAIRAYDTSAILYAPKEKCGYLYAEQHSTEFYTVDGAPTVGNLSDTEAASVAFGPGVDHWVITKYGEPQFDPKVGTTFETHYRVDGIFTTEDA